MANDMRPADMKRINSLNLQTLLLRNKLLRYRLR